MDADCWGRLATALFPEGADILDLAGRPVTPLKIHVDHMRILRERLAEENRGLEMLQQAIDRISGQEKAA